MELKLIRYRVLNKNQFWKLWYSATRFIIFKFGLGFMLSVLIVFISAFLVFLVQPMVAKILLPYFGGGSAVWTGCLLFFQALLLFGYGYAHFLAKLTSFKTQKLVHASVLLIALLNTWFVFNAPMAFSATVQMNTGPLVQLLLALTMTVGLPYFMVTTTGPLIQHWVAASGKFDKPYRLYALSNIGSLLALLSYPFIFEPSFSLSSQTLVWSLIFTFFVILYWVYLFNITSQAAAAEHQNSVRVSIKERVIWLVLSATGVIALIATTSAMTQNIPPVPFLWILPLVIYLLSFVITFNYSNWYVRWYWLVLFLVSSLIALFMFFIGSQFDIMTQVVMYSLILLAVCMLCHGELESLKPGTENLTLFYVYMALGGVTGSLFVNLIAVKWFSLYYEFILCLVLTAGVFIWRLFIPKGRVETKRQAYMMSGFTLVTMAGLSTVFFNLDNQYAATDVAKARNFYGILSVKDINNAQHQERRLVDGTTSHGTQSLIDGEQNIPKSYYRQGTGAHQAILLSTKPSQKVGVVGLGAGTLAAYGRVGDSYRFYELNPAVKRMAQQYFSYLSDSPANVDIVMGDARQSLQNELQHAQQQNFDVLVIDAFSGDSIPMHLLTEQALELYWQHMAKQGVLAFHISNSHLDLTPVLKAHQQTFNAQTLFIKTAASGTESHDALWVLMAKDSNVFNGLEQYLFWPNDKKSVFWTDNYSDLFSVLK